MFGKRRIDKAIQLSGIGIGFEFLIPTRLVKFGKPFAEFYKGIVIQFGDTLF